MVVIHQSLAVNDRTGFCHVARKVGPSVFERIRHLKIGQKMQDLPEHLWHDSFKYYLKVDPDRKGGPNLRMIRLDPAHPSLTVTGFIFNKFVHPWEDRFVTPREAARLQDLPDDFRFSGPLTSVQRQVGNAVPVNLARAIARSIFGHAKAHNTLRNFPDQTKLPSLSLFSGIGAFDLGFSCGMNREQGMGFLPMTAVESDPDCCETMALNGFESLSPTDICQISDPKAFWLQKSGRSDIALVVGGPPCQAFSQAGKQKGTSDERGQLIFQFIRFVGALRPVYFVMENVANLQGVEGGRLYRRILQEFDLAGYRVNVGKLSATDFGTAQRRVRLIFLGVQKPWSLVDMPGPTHGCGEGDLFSALEPVKTVEQAFRGLPRLCA